MIDVQEILKNDTIKDMLKKVGVSDEKAKSVAEQAVNSIKDKYKKDPKQMSSLLSEEKNTDKDEVLKKEVEDDFLEGLVKKVGLPDGVASKVSDALPGIMSMVTSKASGSEGGLSGMLEGVTDFFDGDDDKKDGKETKKKSSFFSKLFGK